MLHCNTFMKHSINNNEASLFFHGTKAASVPAVCDTIALSIDWEIPQTNEHINCIDTLRNSVLYKVPSPFLYVCSNRLSLSLLKSKVLHENRKLFYFERVPVITAYFVNSAILSADVL